ncbi:MAG: glutathione S-transferase [Myxococcota bacterium]|jgi:glutathione S-transferase
MAEASDWTYNAGSAGFGTYAEMLATLEAAIGDGPWLLGDRFTMADVVLGGTLRFMLQFKMIERRERFIAYAARLGARPASVRADAVNAGQLAEHAG